MEVDDMYTETEQEEAELEDNVSTDNIFQTFAKCANLQHFLAALDICCLTLMSCNFILSYLWY